MSVNVLGVLRYKWAVLNRFCPTKDQLLRNMASTDVTINREVPVRRFSP